MAGGVLCALCCRPWTTWTPLIIVLGVAMVKEAIEDYKRYKADKEINNRVVKVLDPGSKQFVDKKWQDVRVGDITITQENHEFAADILFLTAENEEGTCYVQTMNLDGETNLKIKKALDETKDFTEQTLSQISGRIECEAPNSRLYQFQGNLVQGDKTAPISPNMIILRGCLLQNTKRVFGAVIYAGGCMRAESWAADPAEHGCGSSGLARA
jgi:phospholipid-transporting ATPase